ncbi:MAG: DUF1364 domain-containing protein [Candidatus Omnitrophica bacterium]|nr:DUF1364 domain-containing protein [Candidatus Omnitrophota bacterium]
MALVKFKRKPYRNSKILAAAEGQMCTMQSPFCNFDPATTVFCHSNRSEDGKGVGQKADDCFGFFGCSDCHAWYDGTQSYRFTANMRRIYGTEFHMKQLYFNLAMKRTWRILLDEGVLK